jgi:uncharacterized protein (DUF934 family)
MPEVIRDCAAVNDTFQQVLSLAEATADDDIIVPLPVLLEAPDRVLNHSGRVGVWVEPDEEFEALVPYLPRLALVAVYFPVFTDGRGYSIARLLREKYHYRGEIRAVGDVFRDTLFYLARCGFNAFALRPGETTENAVKGLNDFSSVYQHEG